MKRKFAARLRRALEAAELNQTELAERLGVTPAAVNMWLSGVSRPKMDRLVAIGEALGVSVGELLDEKSAA